MKAENHTNSVLDIIRKYAISETVNLPVFPGVAFELQQLLADDSTSIDQVSKVISKDQALATKVLRLANSALFSGPVQIRTIKDALMRLGLNHVFNLVVCTSQRNLYKSKVPVLDKQLQASWKHALCTAIGSKWLVQELGYKELKDEAFLAGLLHDIGKLVLVKVFESMIAKNDDLVLPAVLISKVFVLLHAEQGFKLMSEWGIPEVYCNTARDHHTEDFDRDDTLLMAVRLVNRVCNMEGIGISPETQIDIPALPEVDILGITQDVLDELHGVISEGGTSEFDD
jgi:putative nucleotidyltransferase with HDIG domain